MPSLRVQAAIMDNGRILLIQDAHLPIWTLPGGSVADNQAPEPSLVAHVQRLTALDIRVGRLIGLYARPNWYDSGTVTCLFSGLLLTRHPDTTPARRSQYRMPYDLPPNMLADEAQRIQDAADNQQRACVRQTDLAWPFGDRSPDSIFAALMQVPAGAERLAATREIAQRLGLRPNSESIARWLADRS